MAHTPQVSFSEPGPAASHSGSGAAVLPRLNYLRALEAESVHILREAAAEFARPVMLYSIGKDSSVMLRLAQKAFFPGKIPFPMLHIDTSYKFPEMIEFRDTYARQIGADEVAGALQLPRREAAASVASRVGSVAVHHSVAEQPPNSRRKARLWGLLFFRAGARRKSGPACHRA